MRIHFNDIFLSSSSRFIWLDQHKVVCVPYSQTTGFIGLHNGHWRSSLHCYRLRSAIYIMENSTVFQQQIQQSYAHCDLVH